MTIDEALLQRLADWRPDSPSGTLTVDHPDTDPDTVATRLMNVVWVGAGQLLQGAAWRPRPGSGAPA